MPLPHQFGSVTTAQGAWLDENFNNTGVCTVIPCSAAGTNTLVLSAAAGFPFIGTYSFFQRFSFVSTNANTGPVTAQVGSLAVLGVYKDTPEGPTLLTGGEIATTNLVTLIYDATLAGGAGGFHLDTGGLIGFAQLGNAQNITSNTGVLLTAGQVTGVNTLYGIIHRLGTPGGGFNDQLPTAADIIAAIPQAAPEVRFNLKYINSTAQTATLITNTGLNLVGVMTTGAGAVGHDFAGVVIDTGTPTVNIYG